MNGHPTVVLDTNVLVAALINPFGAPGRIWDLVTSRQLHLVYDDRILLEYETVLRRASFGFTEASVDAVMAMIPFQEFVSAQTWPVHDFPDSSDVMFLEVADAANCPLVTGNLKHFPMALRRTVRVLQPSEFLAGYRCREP